jgi:hypothetical protein
VLNACQGQITSFIGDKISRSIYELEEEYRMVDI